ncbi:uncharacterized protein [Apostichopus japonicus]|uniref:uncharacterized protein n=1 Tax=Stichopus japonicus TaxID=307972 RepID=UPI003AB3A4A2
MGGHVRIHQFLQLLLLTCATIPISGAEVQGAAKTINVPIHRIESTKIHVASTDRPLRAVYHVVTDGSIHSKRGEARLVGHPTERKHHLRRTSLDARSNRVPRSIGTNWAEWGTCNASCGVGSERREGSCSYGDCMGRAVVEWRGCVGIKCENGKRGRSTIVLSAGLLIAGFLGGVLLTTVFLKSSWILDQVNLSKKRNPSKDGKKTTTLDSGVQKSGQKQIEPYYVDVRDLNTNIEDMNDDEDVGEDGYLIPDKLNGSKTNDYEDVKSEPEYIDVIE